MLGNGEIDLENFIGAKRIKKFERKYFIKDLFRPKQVLDCFELVEFESFRAYYNAVKEGFYHHKAVITSVRINDEKEVQHLKKIIETTNVFWDRNNIEIKIKSNLLMKTIEIIKDVEEKIILTVLHDDEFLLLSEFKKYKGWIGRNPLYIEYDVNNDNYVDVFIHLTREYATGLIRFFKLNWDYESFQKVSIQDLTSLEFWINHVNVWIQESYDGNLAHLEIFDIKGKPIFVSERLGLYYNKKHFDSYHASPLIFLTDHKDKNGEDISYISLNWLRSYMDLVDDVLYLDVKPKNFIHSFINYYDNIRIKGSINEIPLITILVMSWFGGNVK